METMKRNSALAAVLLLVATGCATMTDTNDAAIPGGMAETDIAAIVSAANEGEVQEGNVASTRATSADVRSFAQMMVSDHTAAQTNAQGVFSARGISPTDNDTTRTLRMNAQTSVTNLGTYSGAAFDRAYIRHQVEVHQWLLNTFDTVLIPSARTSEVRTLLQTQRGSVAQHLEQARAISGRL